MNRKRRENHNQKHTIETDVNCGILYRELIKNERFWRNNGQYYLAKEYENRIKLLLNNQIEEALKVVKTEGKYCPTRKMSF
mgnify:CR=1 FL=1